MEYLNESFIIEFISANDIPMFDSKSRSNPYINAYLTSYSNRNTSKDSGDIKKSSTSHMSSSLPNHQIDSSIMSGGTGGDYVQSPKRYDCTTAVWNCYRDFRIRPSLDSILTVELLHYQHQFRSSTSLDNQSNKTEINNNIIGKVDIPIQKLLKDETPMTFTFMNFKSCVVNKNPDFSITLRRVYSDKPPPTIRTFFLIRHGESKWNEAQSRINIRDMLDRDHALTEEGIKQATELNSRWRLASLHDTSVLDTPSSMFPDMIDFSRLDDNDLLATCDEDDSDDDNNNDTTNNNSNSNNNNISPNNSGQNELVATTTSTLQLPIKQPQPQQPVSFSQSSNPVANLLDFEESYSDVQTPTSQYDPFSPARVHFNNTTAEVTTNGINNPFETNSSVNSNNPFETNSSVIATNSNDPFATDPFSNYDIDMNHRDSTLFYTSSNSSEIINFLNDDDEGDDGANTVPLGATSRRPTIMLLNGLHAMHDLTTSDGNSDPEKERKDLANRRITFIRLFMRADAVFTSPLTRAIQTAIVSMQGHTALLKNNITYYSTIREIKKLGGLDTVGIEYGAGIIKRVHSEMAATIGFARANDMISKIGINIGDANIPWWTAISSFDSDREQQDRINEFITFSRYCDATLPVFVGHSLFFKAFYCKRVSKLMSKKRPHLSANLKRLRLSNASLLAVTVSYIDKKHGKSDAVILDADLIFGGGFHGGHQDDNSSGTVEEYDMLQSMSEIKSSSEVRVASLNIDSAIPLPPKQNKEKMKELQSNFSNKLSTNISSQKAIAKETISNITSKVHMLRSSITHRFL